MQVSRDHEVVIVGSGFSGIGAAVAFLAGSDSDFITGMTMMVDGGQTILH